MLNPLSPFSWIWKHFPARDRGGIAAAFLITVFFLILIINIKKFNLVDDQELFGMAVLGILLIGLFTCVFSLGLYVFFRVVIHPISRSRKRTGKNTPRQDATEGSPPQKTGRDK